MVVVAESVREDLKEELNHEARVWCVRCLPVQFPWDTQEGRGGTGGRAPCLFSRPVSIPVLPELQMEGTGLLLCPESGGRADPPLSDLPKHSGA